MHRLFVIDLLATHVASSTALPPLERIEERALCIPSNYGNTSEDDMPPTAAAIASCGNGGIIAIPAGTTYSLRSTIDFTGCSGCKSKVLITASTGASITLSGCYR